jgi:hypothetical protein
MLQRIVVVGVALLADEQSAEADAELVLGGAMQPTP